MLGNKCDMNERRQVSKERGEQVSIIHMTTERYSTAQMQVPANKRVTSKRVQRNNMVTVL